MNDFNTDQSNDISFDAPAEATTDSPESIFGDSWNTLGSSDDTAATGEVTTTEDGDDVEVDASFDLTEAEGEDEAVVEDEATTPEEDPWTKPGNWYVVHSQS